MVVGLAGLPSPANAGDGNGNKMVLCHIPPGNPANRHTIMVSESAAKAQRLRGRLTTAALVRYGSTTCSIGPHTVISFGSLGVE
jgi:hypothetical protein